MSTEKELKPMEQLKAALPELKAILQLNANEGVDVQTLVLQELEYLRMHALTKPEIMECVPSTVVMAVKRVLKQNLSMDPYAGLVYVKTRNFKIKNQNGQDEWKKALEIMESCNGILSVSYQCGKIIDHKSPEIKKIMVGEQKTPGRVVEVSFEYQLRSERWEKRTFDESDFMRWRIASHKENGRGKQDADINKLNYANPNYTSWMGGIDPEFARAKAIRHSLKKLGTNPNEGKFAKITMSSEKQVVIDSKADEQSINDESHYAEIIETTKNDAMQPNKEFTSTVKAEDL